MLIADRIRAIRGAKGLSQGDIEKRCGLFRVYLSPVENGHLVPSIATREKLARALEVPLYQLFYEGRVRPLLPHLPKRKLTVLDQETGPVCETTPDPVRLVPHPFQRTVFVRAEFGPTTCPLD
jgi:transcriptional regulator with XRE-family HTH domain